MTCQIYDNFMTKGHKKSHRRKSVAAGGGLYMVNSLYWGNCRRV